MSSDSSSSSSPSPAPSIPSDFPTPPISPLTLYSSESSYPYPRLDPIIEHVKADHTREPQIATRQRVSSVSSISFKSNGISISTGHGQAKAKPASRIRSSSPPPPPRFQKHVSFDNFTGGDATEKNTASFTLNVSHKGYQLKRRSRTFMVGIDENDYSDIALQWLLEELVDDGDEIVCLRVVDRDAKVASDKNVEKKQYRKEANDLLQRIKDKNDDNRAISIVLEFAVGKVHPTFQKMIQLYEPAMLIVGTRGRSLGGFQGLVTNSFSKWCLQYSPVPVVVVRPTVKRMKKKMKRDADPARQDYARILRESGIDEHETESGPHRDSFLPSATQREEAHAVAAALGLPAAFDPTMVPLHKKGSRSLEKVESGQSATTSKSQGSLSPDASRPNSPEALLKSPKSRDMESPAASGDDSSDGEDDEEGEFEAVDGRTLLSNANQPEFEKKMKLHEMEVGEARALVRTFSNKSLSGPYSRKMSVGSQDSTGSAAGGVAIDENEDEEDESTRDDSPEKNSQTEESPEMKSSQKEESSEKDSLD